MHILRATLGTLAVAGFLSVPAPAGAQSMGHDTKGAMAHTMPMSGATMTKEQKIANALTAAPDSVTAKATVLDWPAKEGDAPAVLRAGTNGWSCLPDSPETQGNDPMCLDQSWLKLIDAYLKHTAPQFSALGIGYMIAPGGATGSNTDPYAMAPTADNQWGLHQPHIMIAVPDTKALEGISTDPASGGPYVMWKGTPYAHIMAPVPAAAMGGMKK
jgi:hypothetical protein